MIEVHRHADARAFLDRAQECLARDEAAGGLAIGIARQVIADPTRYEKPTYWATVEDDGAIIGHVFRTPPYQVSITELPPGSSAPVVASLATVYRSLPGVIGPEPTASELAAAWTKRMGGSWRLRMRQRLHAVTNVTMPPLLPPGTLEPTSKNEMAVAVRWLDAFRRDTGVAHTDVQRLAARWIDEGRLFFWRDGEPRCMAASVRDAPSHVSIGGVYTPPAFRNRGYASAAVATLSRLLLDRGARTCTLYTDLSNPTSNAIYGRIGYTPVHDLVDIVIV